MLALIATSSNVRRLRTFWVGQVKLAKIIADVDVSVTSEKALLPYNLLFIRLLGIKKQQTKNVKLKIVAKTLYS